MAGRKPDASVAAFAARRHEKALRHKRNVRERSTVDSAAAAADRPIEEAAARAKERPARRRRLLAFGAIALAASTGLTGCGLSGGLYSMPLPGGADVGDNPLTLHVRMANVYDLVPQASVKVDDVPVGKVTSIDLANKRAGHWIADVTVEVNRDKTKIPSNSTGQLRQTSLLGEKFVSLVAPQTGGTGTVQDNEVLQEDPGYHHVEVEQVLGALSMLLNEGGLPQIRTIAKELNSATTGHEGDIKGLLQNVNTLAAHLDSHSDQITKALDGVARLSTTLNQQKGQLTDAVDNLNPGLKVLADQRGQLVQMLKALQNLSGVAIDTVNKSKDDMIADLKALRPTLEQLNKTGDNLPNSLQLLLTMPFTDYASTTFHGDYNNLFTDLDLNLKTISENLGRSRQNIVGQSVANPTLKKLFGGQQGKQSGQQSPLPENGGGSSSGSGSAPSGGGSSAPGQQGLGGIFNTLSGGGS